MNVEIIITDKPIGEDGYFMERPSRRAWTDNFIGRTGVQAEGVPYGK